MEWIKGYSAEEIGVAILVAYILNLIIMCYIVWCIKKRKF